MNEADLKDWFSLFEKKIGKPKNVEILQEIDVGYNSIVYLITVDGKQYAVKMYNERYNGTMVCVKERDRIVKARRSIPDAVPNVVFFLGHTENRFNREILVMEKVEGVPLNREVFNPQVLEELTDVLKRLHSTSTNSGEEVNEIERINNCRRVIMQFLDENKPIAKERVAKHLDVLEDYYYEKRDAFRNRGTLIHGDLWWDNILVDNDKIRIVDWLESSEQDYCRDLAQLKIGTFDEILDAHKSQHIFETVLDAYKEEFEDESIHDRMQYYLPMIYLEESFYLPFKHFQWEIKYKEDAEGFKKRFIDYFEKSEKLLK